MQLKPIRPMGILGWLARPATVALLAACPLAGLAQQTTDEALLAQKPVLQARLKAIDAERLGFQRDLARREEQCLKQFFSSACLEQIREEHLREMRGYDLRREQTLQSIRDIDAELRSRSRLRRAEDLQQRRPASDQSAPAKGSS